MVDWKKFVEWAFLALLSYFAWQITTDIDGMKNSIVDLNRSVAVMIARDEFQMEDLKDLKFRVKQLEGKHNEH